MLLPVRWVVLLCYVRPPSPPRKSHQKPKLTESSVSPLPAEKQNIKIHNLTKHKIRLSYYLKATQTKSRTDKHTEVFLMFRY